MRLAAQPGWSAGRHWPIPQAFSKGVRTNASTSNRSRRGCIMPMSTTAVPRQPFSSAPITTMIKEDAFSFAEFDGQLLSARNSRRRRRRTAPFFQPWPSPRDSLGSSDRRPPLVTLEAIAAAGPDPVRTGVPCGDPAGLALRLRNGVRRGGQPGPLCLARAERGPQTVADHLRRLSFRVCHHLAWACPLSGREREVRPSSCRPGPSNLPPAKTKPPPSHWPANGRAPPRCSKP